MAAVTSISYLFQQHEARITAALDGFDRGLEMIARGLQDALIDLPNWEPVAGQLMLRQIVHLQSQLRGQLTALGYDDLVQRFMQNGYDASVVFSKTIFKALGKSELILSPMRQDVLAQLRQYDYTPFQDFGNRAIQQISKELVLNAVGGKKRSQVIKDLKANLDVTWSQAQQMADTALRSFDRTVQQQTSEEAGIRRWRYWGPDDKVTREWCHEHVGKEYSLAEIRKMNNGSKRYGDVMRYGGGPRCRHTWLPIAEVNPDDQAESS